MDAEQAYSLGLFRVKLADHAPGSRLLMWTFRGWLLREARRASSLLCSETCRNPRVLLLPTYQALKASPMLSNHRFTF